MRFKGLLAGGLASWVAVGALAAGQAPAANPGAKPAPAASGRGALTPQQEFFETQVRPVLAEKCYACHGPKMQQAGLRLDSKAALLKGTDSGHSVLVPGDPDKSVLLQVVHYDGAVKMPPGAKLPQKAIDALTAWVKAGAPWPSERM